MNKTLKMVLITIVVILGMLFILGVVLNPTETEDQRTKDQGIREAFMEECVVDKSYEDYCNCTYDYLVNNYGEKGFLNIATDYWVSEEVPSEMIDAVSACLGEF